MTALLDPKSFMLKQKNTGYWQFVQHTRKQTISLKKKHKKQHLFCAVKGKKGFKAFIVSFHEVLCDGGDLCLERIRLRLTQLYPT